MWGTGPVQSVQQWATGWMAEITSWSRKESLLSSTASRLALVPTQPTIQWVLRALYPGVKRPGREADHSPPTSAEVEKMWIYTSTSPYAFMA
jgi:hypothetical protein